MEQERLAAVNERIRELLEERGLYLTLGNELSRDPRANKQEIDNAMSSAIELTHALIAARNQKIDILQDRECTTIEEISQKAHDILDANREAKNDFEVLMDTTKPFSTDLFEIFEEDYRIDQTYNFSVARVNTQAVDQVMTKKEEIPKRQEKLLKESKDLEGKLKDHATLMDEFEVFYEDFLRRHEADKINLDNVRQEIEKGERRRAVLSRTKELQLPGSSEYEQTQALFLANERALENNYTKLYVKHMQGLFDRGASNYQDLLDIVQQISQAAQRRTRQYVNSGLKEATVIKELKGELQGFYAIEDKVRAQINYRQRLRDYRKRLDQLEIQKVRLQMEEDNILGRQPQTIQEPTPAVPTPSVTPSAPSEMIPVPAAAPVQEEIVENRVKPIPRVGGTVRKPIPKAPEVKKPEQSMERPKVERARVKEVKNPSSTLFDKALKASKIIKQIKLRVLAFISAGIMAFTMAGCGVKTDAQGNMTVEPEPAPSVITMAERETPPKEEVQSAIGDLVRFNGNTVYHASAQKLGPTGTVGQNIASPQEGIYQITGISIMDANNNYVKVGYQEGVTASQLAQEAGIDLSSGNYTVMNHFNFYKANSEANVYENVKEALRGWTLDDGNYEIVGKSDQHFIIDAIKNLSQKVENEHVNVITVASSTPDREYDRGDRDYSSNTGGGSSNIDRDDSNDKTPSGPSIDDNTSPTPSIPDTPTIPPDEPTFTPAAEDVQAVIKETKTEDGKTITGEYIGTTQAGDEFHATVDQSGNPVYTDKDGNTIAKPDGIQAIVTDNGDVAFNIDESLQNAAETKTDQMIADAEEQKAEELGKESEDLTIEEKGDAFGDLLETPVGGIHYSQEDIDRMQQDYEASLREQANDIVEQMEQAPEEQTPENSGPTL